MALFTPSESPAVVVKETDLTGGVPNVQTTTGATVGRFRWGPVLERKLISNEAELVSTYSNPKEEGVANNTTYTTTRDFHSAAYFLKYSNSLYVTRVDGGASFCNSGAATKGTYQGALDSASLIAVQQINNKSSFDSAETGLIASMGGDGGKYSFIAKYPGDLGNSLKVSYVRADSDQLVADDDGEFEGWAYKASFDQAPKTSAYAATYGSTGDEINVAVIDEDGRFSGTKGTVLEAFENLSVAPDAKGDDGSTNYVKKVINEKSEYVYMLNFDSDEEGRLCGVTNATQGVAYAQATGAAKNYSLSNGVSYSNAVTPGQIQTGFDLYEDRDTVQVDFLIAPGMDSVDDQATIANDLVTTAYSLRKDCVAVTSPSEKSVIKGAKAASTITDLVVAEGKKYTSSSYLIADNNWIKVYDKYNDKYIHIPAASSTAGIMALSDKNTAPWYSPAGQRRGHLLGVTDLAWSPSKTQRDSLYKAYINPIANIPGQGTMLYGDKTHWKRISAFNRINVRRLFLSIERAIAAAAQSVMFEFNDEFTRAEFVNIVEPFLREIQGRRGITDFKLVCDATNNTPAVIDRNEFIANIFIKPARSINYVTLNFVAVRTGVDFSEVVGTV